MFRWNRYTIRGAIATAVGCLGIGYEWFISKRRELFVLLLYGLILGIGVWLLALFKSGSTKKD
jgi:hypothetical protein